MPDPFVPPGGFISWGSQTTATQALLRRKKRPTKKRAKKTATKRRRVPVPKRRAPARPRTKATRPARLVKGSAAAKRYMAKIRKMKR